MAQKAGLPPVSNAYTIELKMPRQSAPAGRIRVMLGDITPTDGRTNPEVFLRVWEEAARFLSQRPTALRASRANDSTMVEYLFAVDASDVLEQMRSATAESLKSGATDARWKQRADAGLHPLGAHMDIYATVDADAADVDAKGGVELQAVARFLQHLFLAMNIAVPGSFSLYLSEYDGLGQVDPPCPQFTGAQFEGAVQWASGHGWPVVSTLAFEEVWAWLGTETLQLNLATEPWQKALFTLWRVSDESAADPERLHSVAQVLESLFGQPGASARQAMAHGVERVLGNGNQARKWTESFYGIRSAFAHGGVPLLRPGHVFDLERDAAADAFDRRYWKDLDAALAVLIGVVQALVQSRARTL